MTPPRAAPLLVVLLGCTPEVVPDDHVPPGDSGPPGDSTPPEETAPPPDTDPPEAPRLVVNEIMPGGSEPDWLELYNGGPGPADLGGWTLSDDWTAPYQATLPAGTLLAEGSFLVLVADGSTEEGHLPFQLSREGEGVGLFDTHGEPVDWVVFPALAGDHAWARLPDGAETWEEVARGTPGSANLRLQEERTTLVPAGATWRYLDTGIPPEAGWTGLHWDDGAWASGPAPLGYGDHQATVVSWGPDAANKHTSTWFRHAFEVSADGDMATLTLSLRLDDGARVWLDGVEVARQNLPTGEVDHTTRALVAVSGSGETAFTDYALDGALAGPGAHQLAVEVHQASAGSSDLTLDLALEAVRWVPAR